VNWIYASVFRTVAVMQAVVIAVLTIVGWVFAGKSLAQAPLADMPLQFRFIGEFYDPDKDDEKGGVNAFTVTVGRKKWILDVEKAQTMTGSALGSSVLKAIYPPILTFVGPEDLVKQLNDPRL